MIPLQTFHLFTTLPTELQDLIWSHAVRPVPGNRHVHNFFLSDRLINLHDQKRKLPGDDLRFDGGYRYEGVRISVPHQSERYPRCRTTSALKGLKNESAYSTDSGLWTACRASRFAMERYFTRNEQWSEFSESSAQSQINGSRRGHFQDQPGSSHTIAYNSSGEDQPCHEPRWITIRPGEDLMILKHPGLSCVDWFHLYAWNFTPRIHPAFFGCHIALDYDPVWLDVLQGLMLRRCPVRITADTTSIVDMVKIFYDEDEEGDADTAGTLLWFIDHRLRRVCEDEERIGEEEREHFTFRSVNYLFTEVMREEMGTQWMIEDHVENEGSVFEFFESLDRHPALTGIASSNRVRVLAREPVLGSDATVDITKTGYRIQLGDACFDSPETKIQPARRTARVVERVHVEDDDEDIDIADFDLFGDD